MTEKIYITALCVIAIALAILATLYVVRFVLSCRKSARMEGKMIADSKRLIWRIVNTGTRDITIVEIGIKCAERNRRVESEQSVHIFLCKRCGRHRILL